MRTKRLLAFVCAAGLLCAFGGSVRAQGGAPGTLPPQPRQHHGLMSRMHGHMPMMHGNIVGNKQSHVYHMPGDRGSLPAEKNRVYFRTEAEAQRAGYHRAGMGMHANGRMSHGAAGHHMGRMTGTH